MPLYKLPVASLPQYMTFFNNHAVNGVLNHTVIKGLLAKKGIQATDERITQVITSISLDTTGITCQAFLDLISNYHELRNPDQEYRSAFRLYDVNETGKLCKHDVETMFRQMHRKMDVDALFDEADLDKNGYIDYDEFVTLMEKV